MIRNSVYNSDIKELYKLTNEVIGTLSSEDLPDDKQLVSIKEELEKSKKDIEEFNNEMSSNKIDDAKRLVKTQTYIEFLDKIVAESDDPNQIELAKKQIALIKDSLILDILSNHNSIIQVKDINKYLKLTHDKLSSNKDYIFPSPSIIYPSLKKSLPEEYTSYSKKITCLLLSFIMSKPLKEYSIYVYFVMLNIKYLSTVKRDDNWIFLESLKTLCDKKYKH